MNENRLDGVKEKEQENTIAIWDILLSVCGKWWLILLVAVICGSVVKVHIDSTYVDLYSSSGSIYLVSKNDGQQFVAPDVSYAGTMMEDYIYRISTEENFREAVSLLPDMIRSVYAESGVSEQEVEYYVQQATASMSWSALDAATEIVNPEDTRYLKISVVSTDPKLSYAAVSAVLQASLDSLSDFFGVEQVAIDEQPRLPAVPSSHKSYQNAYLAALIGAALVIALLVLLYLRDDKINTSEDVEKYLGLTVLAMIPETDSPDGMHKQSPKSGERRQT